VKEARVYLPIAGPCVRASYHAINTPLVILGASRDVYIQKGRKAHFFVNRFGNWQLVKRSR